METGADYDGIRKDLARSIDEMMADNTLSESGRHIRPKFKLIETASPEMDELESSNIGRDLRWTPATWATLTFIAGGIVAILFGLRALWLALPIH